MLYMSGPHPVSILISRGHQTEAPPMRYPSESISGRRLTNSEAGEPSEYPLVVSSVTTRRPPTHRYTWNGHNCHRPDTPVHGTDNCHRPDTPAHLEQTQLAQI